MESFESVLADLKTQLGLQATELAAQATQIAQLNTELNQLRARLPWKPPETFDLFPELPTEIRHEIWQLAMPGPQLIALVRDKSSQYSAVWIDRGNRRTQKEGDRMEIRYSLCADGTYKEEEHSKAFTRLREESARLTPALLCACQESRRVAIRAYDYCMTTSASANFRVRVPGYKSPESIIPNSKLFHVGHRFRPSCDTIYLKEDPYFLWRYLTECEPSELQTENIRSLALPYEAYMDTVETALFTGLDEMIVITSEEDEDEARAVEAISCRESVRLRLGTGQHMTKVTPQPVLRVMTEDALFDYVSSKHQEKRPRDPMFQVITPLYL